MKERERKKISCTLSPENMWKLNCKNERWRTTTSTDGRDQKGIPPRRKMELTDQSKIFPTGVRWHPILDQILWGRPNLLVMGYVTCTVFAHTFWFVFS